ncbi:phosphotransferase [Microbacterium paraoxydans]|uniref:phosphotransferase n=1 Tax=Microbacterium paraoxydans TaxID=199592 RepID=UPI001CFB53BC|nr:phosphotransferase [Microbacterium paraoxydans]
MHDGELALETEVAARLIVRRFPELHGEILRPITATGTVNRIIRVGDGLVARFPRLATSEPTLVREAAALDELAGAIPFPAPRPYGTAAASEEFDSAWAIQSWIEGEPLGPLQAAASEALAQDLVVLIRALRSVDVRGRVFDGNGRGGRLGDHDGWVSECLSRSDHLIDVERTARLWAALRALPPADVPLMSHRDLTPFNLLVIDRGDEVRLAGVLDGGGFGPADPALDLVAAWHILDAPARRLVRDGISVGEAEWRRGAGWALQQALGLGWYYENSNPEMSALGVSTVRRVLADPELSVLID